MIYNYYFALATSNFLLHEEPIEEILRERTAYYNSINKDIDFWLVSNMEVISMYVNISSIHSYTAIISFDQEFITWLKLRIGFVNTGHFQCNHLILT
uniref:Ycf54 n=1 Tax=Crouania attenuata TaxID=42002 RepID=A0A4D6WPA0_9FLOR|nr:hypothetical protein [Crouania attenuata]